MPSAPSWRICSRSSSRSPRSSSSPSSPMAYSLPRSEKYTSNTVSNARQCALFFTSVAASAYLNASRSDSGMWRTACIASRFSVRLTGRPASRNSCMKPASSERIGSPVAGKMTSASSATRGGAGLLPALAVGRELLHGLGDVALVLEQDVDRARSAASASTFSMPSSNSVRAQSSVSDTDGRPSYANIALLRAWLDVHAGLADDGYASAIVDDFRRHGCFTEYGSPTYYGIDLLALGLWQRAEIARRRCAAGATNSRGRCGRTSPAGGTPGSATCAAPTRVRTAWT